MITREDLRDNKAKVAGAVGLMALVAGTPLYLKYGHKPVKDLKDLIKKRLYQKLGIREKPKLELKS